MSSCITGKPVWSAFWVVIVGTGTLLAAPTPAQMRQANALKTQIVKAATLHKQGKYIESGKVVREVQQRVEQLLRGADDDLIKVVEPVFRRLVRVHALLELEGIELPSLKKLQDALRPGPTPTSSGGTVSFTKQVAPLLVAKCGRCHVSAARGEFSMATYVALLRGSAAGVVIFPDDPDGSRIVEVIAASEMPRGGGRVSLDELDLLKRWIRQGAKFDGESQQASLSEFASGNPANPVMAKSTGNETVGFSRDIAPVLSTSCAGCHVNARRPRGRLNMSNFAGLFRGGDSGPPVFPRDPAGSILLQRIKGEGGQQRMPAGGRPVLSDEVIAKFEKWIAEGGTFDGPDPRQNVVELAAVTKARRATHEELSVERAQLAEQNWRLAMGEMPFSRSETKNFLALGNVGKSAVEDFAKRAELLAPRIANMLGASADQPLLKGRLTLFLFNQRYDYSEFGQMVEQRPLPKEWRGHWRYTVVDAYGAMIAPRGEQYTLEGLVGQQMAGSYVASLGAPPRWFCEGTARVIASRLAPQDTRITAWDHALSGVIASMSQPDDFLKGRLPAEDTDIASYSYVRFLMTDSQRFRALLMALANGQSFDRSFATIYGASAAKITQTWIRRAASRVGRRRR